MTIAGRHVQRQFPTPYMYKKPIKLGYGWVGAGCVWRRLMAANWEVLMTEGSRNAVLRYGSFVR